MSHKKEFISLMRGGFDSHHVWQVFSDFCELSAIAIEQQMVYFTDEREARYMEIIGRYNKEKGEPNRLGELMTITHKALAERFQDFLGEIFMELELSNHWRGQFFTPYNICKMMAMMTAGQDVLKLAEAKDVVKIGEPCCGSGAMLIALADYIQSNGGELSNIRVSATDVDQTAANMAYIQLAILGVPACVTVGNALLDVYTGMGGANSKAAG